MMTQRARWYCTHCGGERPVEPNFQQIDPRYATVVCRTGREKDFFGSPIKIPRNRLVLDEFEHAVGRLYPGVRDRTEAYAMIKTRRLAKVHQSELRRVQLGNDYWSNPDKRRQLQPVTMPKPRARQEAER